MKVQKRDIPLNAKSKVGYHYIGEINKHKELLDDIANKALFKSALKLAPVWLAML